jgi:hypothetical protein
MMNGRRNALHDVGKQPGGPPSVFITRRHPEAAESGKAKDSPRRISALRRRQHKKRRVPHFSRPLRKVGASNLATAVPLTRTLSSRAEKDRPPADDLAQSRDLVSAGTHGIWPTLSPPTKAGALSFSRTLREGGASDGRQDRDAGGLSTPTGPSYTSAESR